MDVKYDLCFFNYQLLKDVLSDNFVDLPKALNLFCNESPFPWLYEQGRHIFFAFFKHDLEEVLFVSTEDEFNNFFEVVLGDSIFPSVDEFVVKFNFWHFWKEMDWDEVELCLTED